MDRRIQSLTLLADGGVADISLAGLHSSLSGYQFYSWAHSFGKQIFHQQCLLSTPITKTGTCNSIHMNQVAMLQSSAKNVSNVYLELDFALRAFELKYQYIFTNRNLKYVFWYYLLFIRHLTSSSVFCVNIPDNLNNFHNGNNHTPGKKRTIISQNKFCYNTCFLIAIVARYSNTFLQHIFLNDVIRSSDIFMCFCSFQYFQSTNFQFCTMISLIKKQSVQFDSP